LVKGRLQPGNVIEGDEAVVIPQQLDGAGWHGDLHRIVLHIDRNRRRRRPHTDFVRDLKSPLSTILEQITAICEQRGIHAVASIGIGFEDEAPALRQWLSQNGTPLKLTIYCPTDGDFLSLAGMLH
jgi:hypothetical protein